MIHFSGRCRLAFGLTAAILAIALPGRAKVAEPTVSGLLKLANVVVIGKVLRVRKFAREPVAEVKVLTNIRGVTAGQTVYVHVGKTWACDASRAKTGETLALLLVPWTPRPSSSLPMEPGQEFANAFHGQHPGQQIYRIGWHGLGRLRTKSVRGKLLINAPYAEGPSVQTGARNRALPGWITVEQLRRLAERHPLPGANR